jgi:hypothetical protein
MNFYCLLIFIDYFDPNNYLQYNNPIRPIKYFKNLHGTFQEEIFIELHLKNLHNLHVV